jgi:hypothetical protein
MYVSRLRYKKNKDYPSLYTIPKMSRRTSCDLEVNQTAVARFGVSACWGWILDGDRCLRVWWAVLWKSYCGSWPFWWSFTSKCTISCSETLKTTRMQQLAQMSPAATRQKPNALWPACSLRLCAGIVAEKHQEKQEGGEGDCCRAQTPDVRLSLFSTSRKKHCSQENINARRLSVFLLNTNTIQTLL